ncbi:resistance to Congo red protein [Aspergillus saccharolyticus JOP 1030-1]|uniref:Chitin synthesis regulation, resistance to congo red-domain-containing protein n=1 Tax=Aspergillus saccharolyticus JOP 1030-1 TaxID=1450539 RepID=A0A318Z2C1_9EURO|nr:hypothetical protein BP01DRAFT_169018 [Aspergillus saccharolyticus JOP 1030-1]PYH41441.1 hypothetical protein BP01DRAFT_169018 [Aspergillus saccharolyticus JOP 1030-1]
MGVLLHRRDCHGYGDNYYCDSNSWYDWGRWIAFAVIVGVALVVFFLFACFNARRRRRQGLRPHPGTAWLAGPPPTFQQSQQQQQPGQPYYADPYYQPAPPPQYSPHPQYGYFGGQPQQTGIELQTPPNAYHNGGERVYQPPPGPPPASKV